MVRSPRTTKTWPAPPRFRKDVEEALLQRLKLKPGKVKQLADGARAIANMEEPIGKPLSAIAAEKGFDADQGDGARWACC